MGVRAAFAHDHIDVRSREYKTVYYCAPFDSRVCVGNM